MGFQIRWTKRRGPVTVGVGRRSASISYKLGPLSVSTSGRVYLFGIRIK